MYKFYIITHIFNEKYGRHGNIQQLVNKFEETGSVNNRNSDQPKIIYDEFQNENLKIFRQILIRTLVKEQLPQTHPYQQHFILKITKFFNFVTTIQTSTSIFCELITERKNNKSATYC